MRRMHYQMWDYGWRLPNEINESIMTLFLQVSLNISVAHEVTEKHDAQTPRLS